MEQFSIFDYTRTELRIDKPIRLVELFCGYGSQAMALENLNIDFDHYLAIDFDKYAMASYNAVHGTDFPVVDICDVNGSDLKIVDTDNLNPVMFILGGVQPDYHIRNTRVRNRVRCRIGTQSLRR